MTLSAYLLTFMLAVALGTAACVATDHSARSEIEKASVTRAFYDAFYNDPLTIYSQSAPWPDEYLHSSDSYEGCANIALTFSNLGEDLFLKALQVCERRHPGSF